MTLKERVEEVESKMDKFDFKIKCLQISMTKVEEVVTNLNKLITRAKSTLDAHVNRQYAEIRVVEADGKWGDYSGMFYIDDNTAKEVVIEKAREHFDNYFTDSVHHRNKKLGLFVFSPRSGKTLIEKLETN